MIGYRPPLVSLLLFTAPLTAQQTVCFHAKPRPACSAFFVTNAGGYFSIRGSNTGQPATGPRVLLLDWGIMGNIGENSAAGASFFFHWDDDGGIAGPAVRYRRWLQKNSSLDFALGIAATGSDTDLKPGSVYGLVKWNPTHWFGLALRPELVQRGVITCSGSSVCTSATHTQAQVSIGFELGWWPGLALGTASLLLTRAARADAGQ